MRALLLVLSMLLCGAAATAQDPGAVPFGPPVPAPAPSGNGPGITLQLNGGGNERENLGSAIEIVLLMTVLAMAPAIVMTMTCFTRIIIVLSFLKRAMSMQDLPPSTVVTGFALFLTIFVMRPVVNDVYDQAYTPYVEGRMDWREASGIAAGRMNEFMLKQTRTEDIELILELSRTAPPAQQQDIPLHVTIPAFVLSEIKTSFQMGFVLFLPFVVIDLVISSILVSMGMFTLPPVVVSTPLKLLLFILVGGWDLVVVSLAESFAA